MSFSGAEITVCVNIVTDADIVTARQKGRELAIKLGLSSIDAAMIATAISELARNILLYAKGGQISVGLTMNGLQNGLVVVVARDDGPGIPDIRQAMEPGYSTSRSLGLGLPGVKRLMDEFEIESEIGRGTTVTVKKWKP
jgi:serine/threonine-protein kinase RsbT